ncbi:MAG: hypothetical protein WCK02_04935 [Bacteroidota bacterium]
MDKSVQLYLKIFKPLSIVCWIASLFFVAFTSKYEDVYGFFLVILGWLSVFSFGAGFTWLANPILWYAWFNYKKTKKSFNASLISTIVSLLFLLFQKISLGGKTNTPNTDQLFYVNTDDIYITGYGFGYFLWVLSSLIMLIGNYIRMQNPNSEPEIEECDDLTY